MIGVTRDFLSTRAKTAAEILFGPRVSTTLRRSNEATSALLERLFVCGKASRRKMQNACHATSTSIQYTVSSNFYKRVSRSYDNLKVIFCRCMCGLRSAVQVGVRFKLPKSSYLL